MPTTDLLRCRQRDICPITLKPSGMPVRQKHRPALLTRPACGAMGFGSSSRREVLTDRATKPRLVAAPITTAALSTIGVASLPRQSGSTASSRTSSASSRTSRASSGGASDQQRCRVVSKPPPQHGVSDGSKRVDLSPTTFVLLRGLPIDVPSRPPNVEASAGPSPRPADDDDEAFGPPPSRQGSAPDGASTTEAAPPTAKAEPQLDERRAPAQRCVRFAPEADPVPAPAPPQKWVLPKQSMDDGVWEGADSAPSASCTSTAQIAAPRPRRRELFVAPRLASATDGGVGEEEEEEEEEATSATEEVAGARGVMGEVWGAGMAPRFVSYASWAATAPRFVSYAVEARRACATDAQCAGDEVRGAATAEVDAMAVAMAAVLEKMQDSAASVSSERESLLHSQPLRRPACLRELSLEVADGAAAGAMAVRVGGPADGATVTEDATAGAWEALSDAASPRASESASPRSDLSGTPTGSLSGSLAASPCTPLELELPDPATLDAAWTRSTKVYARVQMQRQCKRVALLRKLRDADLLRIPESPCASRFSSLNSTKSSGPGSAKGDGGKVSSFKAARDAARAAVFSGQALPRSPVWP